MRAATWTSCPVPDAIAASIVRSSASGSFILSIFATASLGSEALMSTTASALLRSSWVSVMGAYFFT